jgi:hypothetical protein
MECSGDAAREGAIEPTGMLIPLTAKPVMGSGKLLASIKE